MKFATRFFVPAVLSFAAVGAIASELPPEVPFTSSASRAQVMADAAQALRSGSIGAGNVTVMQTVAASSQTRQQVRAEAAVANRLGLIATGEVHALATPAQLEQMQLVSRQTAQGAGLAQGAGASVVR